MILNVTQTPFARFNTAQRLATHGERVIDVPLLPSDDFEALENQHFRELVLASKIIVDNDGAYLILNNDICNAVMCPLVTLDVCIDEDISGIDKYQFVEYNPDELC